MNSYFTLNLIAVQVVQDVRYFQRVKWQNLVLDEAQAIKSSTRYKIRNRLAFFMPYLYTTFARKISM